jgi:hypothetical protein
MRPGDRQRNALLGDGNALLVYDHGFYAGCADIDSQKHVFIAPFFLL